MHGHTRAQVKAHSADATFWRQKSVELDATYRMAISRLERRCEKLSSFAALQVILFDIMYTHSLFDIMYIHSLSDIMYERRREKLSSFAALQVTHQLSSVLAA